MYQLKLSGDFRKLEKFARNVATLPEQMTTLRVALLEEALDLVREGFETSTNPYGERWADLKVRAGQPLRDTGGLSNWQRRGFYIEPTKDYAGYHQDGTGIYGPHHQRIVPVQARALRFPGPGGVIFARSVEGVPRRRMVPDPGPLPSRWRERFIATTHEVLSQHFK